MSTMGIYLYHTPAAPGPAIWTTTILKKGQFYHSIKNKWVQNKELKELKCEPLPHQL